MHNAMAERKTFSNILIAIHESKTSYATTNRAIDCGVNIAQDYDSQQIILRVIRADARVHGIYVVFYSTLQSQAYHLGNYCLFDVFDLKLL